MKFDLEGKLFRSVSNTANGEVGADTVFRYHQKGNIVTADYSGGPIIFGQLLAVVRDNGQLDMRYHHLNDKGEFKFGKCASAPELLSDGRLKFKESWQWLSGDQSKGFSEIEEFRLSASKASV